MGVSLYSLACPRTHNVGQADRDPLVSVLWVLGLKVFAILPSWVHHFARFLRSWGKRRQGWLMDWVWAWEAPTSARPNQEDGIWVGSGQEGRMHWDFHQKNRELKALRWKLLCFSSHSFVSGQHLADSGLCLMSDFMEWVASWESVESMFCGEVTQWEELSPVHTH